MSDGPLKTYGETCYSSRKRIRTSCIRRFGINIFNGRQSNRANRNSMVLSRSGMNGSG